MGLAHRRDRPRATATVAGMWTARPVFGFEEVGAYRVKAPAVCAGGFPAIEVAACATNVDLAVDRTAATQQLAGRPQKSAAVDRRVRLLAIAPVVSRMADQSPEESGNAACRERVGQYV